MTNPTEAKGWTKSRYGFAAFFFFSLLAALFLLRAILFVEFGRQTPNSAGSVILAFVIGLHQDVVVALLTTVPLLFWLWMVRDRWFGKLWHRLLLAAGLFVFWFIQVFLLFTEYYFFEEFRSRFNTVAVDYLLYPTEVFGNIRDSYPLNTVLVVCGVISLAWVIVALRVFRRMWVEPTKDPARILKLVGLMATAAWGVIAWDFLGNVLHPTPDLAPRFVQLTGLAFSVGWAVAALWTFATTWRNSDGARSRFLRLAFAVNLAMALLFTVSMEGTQFSRDRTLNEIADNGSISFVDAAWTHNLDYAAYYRTLPREEAFARVRKILTTPNSTFTGDSNSLLRVVAGHPERPRLNVVILLEEALGSEFWGCLGRTNTLTPEMDKIATEDGMLFTNIYACGNRTVRGFEGVFSSFPPLPGDSIVKRDRSENVESVARVLKRDGYNTLFLYGGRGLFDGMRAYAMNNGWDRFIEQKDFANPTFATIWGVCDEDLYARSIEEFRKLNETGKPFFGTLLTVSNHKPYTYPRGRIDEDPELPKPNRRKAVKYTDWCLGQFFKAARKEAFWTNTVFVVIADHGARVYGAQEIPIFSYEIPLVIVGPAVVKQPQRIGVLGNSLDVSPTILGLIGRPYETMFFGRDLLNDPPAGARALLNHNRSIGIYADSRMAILGLQKTVKYYSGDPKVSPLKQVDDPSPEFIELEKDATALYQVADELYMNRLYRIDGMSSASNAPATSVESNSERTEIR